MFHYNCVILIGKQQSRTGKYKKRLDRNRVFDDPTEMKLKVLKANSSIGLKRVDCAHIE